MNGLSPEERDVLREAKTLIVSNWSKGSGIHPPADGYCLLSALASAQARAGIPFVGTWENPCDMALRKELGRNDLHTWNDAPERTHAEVVALFDRVLTADRPQPEPDPEDSTVVDRVLEYVA